MGTENNENKNIEVNKERSIANVSEAFSKAWGEIKTPKHNKKVNVRLKKGGQYQFEYTDLTGIFDAIKPAFAKNGLSVTQDVKTSLANNTLYLSVTTKIIHSSGEFLESSPMIVVANQNMQEMGGQVTYLKRYSLSAMLGLSTEEDDDGNASVGNHATNANNNQQYQSNNQPTKPTPPKPEKISMAQKNEITKLMQDHIHLRPNATIPKILDFLNISDLELISTDMANKTIATLKKMNELAKKKNEKEAGNA